MPVVKYDEGGKILVVGSPEFVGGENCLTVGEEDLPGDFMDTFSLGKYKVADGTIQATPGWVAPLAIEAP